MSISSEYDVRNAQAFFSCCHKKEYSEGATLKDQRKDRNNFTN